MLKGSKPWLQWLASALVAALAAWLLWRQLRGLSLEQLRAAWRATPDSAIALSLCATAVSFACLAAYERLATEWIAPGRVPRPVAIRVGVVAHALGNTLGFHALMAVALRLRAYRAHGIDATTLARIVAVIGGCVAVGVLSISALALAWTQLAAGRSGIVLFVGAALTAAALFVRLRLRQMGIASPVLVHAGRLVLIGSLEMAAAVAALWVLVPAGALPEPAQFVLVFVGALLLGIVSHSPGGLGVFEATVLTAAPDSRRAEVLVALLAYRVAYNLLPCALALVAQAASWVSARSEASSRLGRRA